jgi:hypothetical protein
MQSKQRGQSLTVLPWEQAVVMWGLYHAQVNLYRRLASIYAYLKGAKASPLPDKLLPATPLGPTEAEKIKNQFPSRDQLQQWVQLPGFWNL